MATFLSLIRLMSAVAVVIDAHEQGLLGSRLVSGAATLKAVRASCKWPLLNGADGLRKALSDRYFRRIASDCAFLGTKRLRTPILPSRNPISARCSGKAFGLILDETVLTRRYEKRDPIKGTERCIRIDVSFLLLAVMCLRTSASRWASAWAWRIDFQFAPVHTHPTWSGSCRFPCLA